MEVADKKANLSQKKKKSRYRQLNKFQSIINVNFKDKSLLNRALTHRSHVNETGVHLKDNERLEYLGDSVLALVVNEYLFKRFGDYLEGDLAKIKSAVVSEATLSKISGKINMGSFLLMGRGEEQSGGRSRTSILANALEAVIGAIYLDSGLKQSKKFILSLIKTDIERINELSYFRDPKTTLQEYVQKKYKERPLYEIIKESGPDHKKEFSIRLIIHEKEISIGLGSSKRRAEMDAATKALELIYKDDKPD